MEKDIISGINMVDATNRALYNISDIAKTHRYKIYYGNMATGTCSSIKDIRVGYIGRTIGGYTIRYRLNRGRGEFLDTVGIIRVLDTTSKNDVVKHSYFNFWANSRLDAHGLIIKNILNNTMNIRFNNMVELKLEDLAVTIVYNTGERVLINSNLKELDECTGVLSEVNIEQFRSKLIQRGYLNKQLNHITSSEFKNNGVLFLGNTVNYISNDFEKLSNVREYILGRRSYI